jgi:hypothetical protein
MIDRRVHLRVFVAAAGAVIIGLILAMTTFSLTTGRGIHARDAYFYVNGFKFLSGAFSLGMAIYFTFGPEARRAFDTRWLPPADIPLAALLLYYLLGSAMVLASAEAFTGNPAIVVFSQVIAYATAVAAISGYAVFSFDWSVRMHRERTEPKNPALERRR